MVRQKHAHHEGAPRSTTLPEEDPDSAALVLGWRRAERERLLAVRSALTVEEREQRASAIEAKLDQHLGDVRGRVLGLYWPIKAEPNLRRWMERVHGRGGLCALPVIVQRKAPLIYRAWWPGAPMTRGQWGIPEPVTGPVVTPDVMIAPMVGFDDLGYRLGYGGGYYDRTLASLQTKPLVVGVAYSNCRLASIRPLAHDVPMDLVITDAV